MSCTELRDAAASYDGEPVLMNVDLKVATGARVAVTGSCGAEKSPLQSLLYDLRPQDIALVPQAVASDQTLSVFHNVYMSRLDRCPTAYNLRTLIWPAPDELNQVSSVLADVDLADKIRNSAGALSGGQKQRVSVARALYNGRPILLADEPVSALDRVQSAAILGLLRQRYETMVLAMHDVTLALEYADRIVVLEHGRKVIDQPSASLSINDLIDQFAGGPV